MSFSVHRSLWAALVAVPMLLLADAAQAQDRPSFIDDLFNNRQDRPPATKGQGAPDDSDMVVRIEQLENQIRQLTGTIEQLQYRNQQLEQQLQRVQADQGAPQTAARPGMPPPPQQQQAQRPMQPMSAPPMQSGPSPVATPVAPGRRGDVFDPSQNPNAPGAPRALGSNSPIIAPEPGAEPPPVGAPGGRPAGAPLDLSSISSNAPNDGQLPPPPARNPNATGAQMAVLPPSNTPKDQYDLAYGYVLRKDYALAEESFRAFLKQYPSDRLTPDAHYWLGETMFQRQRYQDAADSFLVVVRNYDTSGKAPDALLRLGQSLAAIGQKEMACASLAEVGRKYPRASASVKRGVEQEQKRAHC
jgi:tol-pal system protein YbgF